ncbi:MAG: hypothetical protein JW891_06680 [Candidatus Lokiarchaeota archaeon]|nr:hypothetical protein [Candidatus Lokiarchaeota archaeon]
MDGIYTLNIFVGDLFLTLFLYLYILATIIAPFYLKKKGKISKFAARKTVHLLTGLVVLFAPFLSRPYGRFWAVLVAFSLTIIVYNTEKNSKIKILGELYQAIGEEAEDKLNRSYLQGPFHYCVSITFLITLFVILGFWEDQIYLPIAGILIMIISDTLASVVGKKYGKIKINLSWTGTTRSLEGSLVFMATAFLLAYFSFYVFGFLYRALSIEVVFLYSIVTAIVSTVIELVSPSTWDDLTVPIISTLVMWIALFFI